MDVNHQIIMKRDQSQPYQCLPKQDSIMKSIYIITFFLGLSAISFSQSALVNSNPANVAAMANDGSRGAELHGGGLFQKNSIRVFIRDSLALVGTYDDFKLGGYLGLYGRNEKLTLDLFGDASDILANNPAFGQIRLMGRSNPSVFPFPGSPGLFISSIQMVNTVQNQRWEIGFQGHNRGIFPSNFTETELVFKYNTAEVANIDENGVYSTVSDRKYKVNIEALPPVLQTLMEITPSSYQMGNPDASQKNIGLIAQDVKKHFPELVKEKHDGTDSLLMLNYSGMIPITVKAVQELKQLVDDQENEIQSLKNQISRILERVDQLEARRE